jgi:hypothetical protein
MSIENTLTRIADALERLVDLNAGRNLLLEQQTGATEVAEVADEVVKTASRRGRPRKTEKEEPATTPAPAEEKTEPSAEKTEGPKIPTIEELQLRAPALAQKHGKIVADLVRKCNPDQGNISSMTDVQRMAFAAALDELEGATAGAEFQ